MIMGPKRKVYQSGSMIKGFELIEEIEPHERNGILCSRKGRFHCTCGAVFVMSLYGNSHVKLGCDSCRSKNKKLRQPIHGCAKNGQRTKLYRCWQGIQNRCYCSSHAKYKNYGGRGITCDWTSFVDFRDYVKANFGLDDIPSHLTIDRIDPNLNYAPGNIRFVDWNTQANNKVNSHRLIFNGEEMTLAQLSDRTGIKQGSLWGRLVRMGKIPEEAVALGVFKRKTGYLNGVELSVEELALRENVTKTTIFRRLNRGMYQK